MATRTTRMMTAPTMLSATVVFFEVVGASVLLGDGLGVGETIAVVDV